MDQGDLNVDFDESLLDGTNKRTFEDDELLLNELNKKTKLEDDPLESMFADLPPLDTINSSTASPDKTTNNNTPALLNILSTQKPTAARRKSSAAELKQLESSTPSIAASTPTAAAPPKKVTKAQLKKEAKLLAAANSTNSTGTTTTKEESNDPDKLSDAILAAGIDLKAEETLLLVANQSKVNTSTAQVAMTPAKLQDFKQFGGFMNKVIKENALNQLTASKTDIVELVQLACDNFLKDIITNSVVYSRHRRRPLRSKVKSSSTQRSDISKALKELAVKDKEAEEKRMKKRAALGMDNGDDKIEKAGAEETLHRAANATAAMMMAGPKKKKYSWMTGSSNGAGGSGATQTNGSTNSAIAARGDTGIRYREAREEPGIVLRDLVAALETKRIGVDRSLTKAYSKL